MATIGEYLQIWKLKFSTTKTESWAFHLNNKEAKLELNVNILQQRAKRQHTTTTGPSAPNQIPWSNVGQVAHVSPTPWVSSQEADITLSAPEASCWFRGGCWRNNVAHGHLSPGTFNRRELRTCLVPQCWHQPHWPRHQQRLANCDWMPVSYISGQPSILAGIQPAELRRKEAILSLAGCAMEPRHQFHSALTCPSSANARHLKSRHPFVPTAQQLISLSDNTNIHASHWADHQWNAEWSDNPTTLRTFIPDTGMAAPEWSSQEQRWSELSASAPVSNVSAPACVRPPLRPVSVAHKNKPSTMLSSNVQSIDLLMNCTAWRFWTMR